MTGTGTKHRQVRGITDDKWKRFGESTDSMDTDRSKAIRDFIDYYNGDSDEMPQRPEK